MILSNSLCECCKVSFWPKKKFGVRCTLKCPDENETLIMSVFVLTSAILYLKGGLILRIMNFFSRNHFTKHKHSKLQLNNIKS